MASPERGYERPAESLGGSGHAAVAIVLALAVFLAVVILKPWGRTAIEPLPAVRAHAAAQAPAANPPAIRPTAPAATPPWPASVNEVPGNSATMTEARLSDLARHAGAWGVWVAGAGPRLIREEPWTDWVAVRPEPSTSTPSHVATWPGTDVCDHLPVLAGAPSVVALTTPKTLPADSWVYGWWTDGAQVASLSGSIGAVVPTAPAGLGRPGLLVRTDGAPWPSGRYELHIRAGTSTTALTFCLRTMG